MNGQAGMGDVTVPCEVGMMTRETSRMEDDIEAGGRRALDGEQTAQESAAPESQPTRRVSGAQILHTRRDEVATAASAAEVRPRSSLGSLRMRSFYSLIRRHSSADDDSVGDTVSRSYRLPTVLLRIPNTAFGMPMGLAGHAIMWRSLGQAGFLVGAGDGVRDAVASMGRVCWYAACVTGGTAAALYGYKILASFALVRAEYLDEVRCHFFNAPNLIFVMLLLGVPDGVEVSDDGGSSSLSLGFASLIRTLFLARRRPTNIFFFLFFF